MSKVIFAAGGLLSRQTPEGPEIAVIFRSRYNDWTLPKGKLQKGELWEDAALREVKEEVGCESIITGFAGVTEYLVKGIPKVVLFWHMIPKEDFIFQPNDEVKDLKWMKYSEVIKQLDYPGEKELLKRSIVRKKPSIFKLLLNWLRNSFSVTQRRQCERLLGAISAYTQELDTKINCKKINPENLCWLLRARAILNQCEKQLQNKNTDGGWRCFHAAQRMEILSLENNEELKALASILRQECEKLSSWRKKATYDLIGSPESPKNNIQKDHIYQAALIRDEHYTNGYYKINLMRDQFRWLSLILFLVLIGIYVYFQNVPQQADLYKKVPLMLIGVTLFGLLGGTISSIFSVRKSSAQTKIPELVSNFVYTFMRVLVGAGSALIIYIFLRTDFLIDIVSSKTNNIYTFYAISFVAGFSERLLTKAVETIVTQEK